MNRFIHAFSCIVSTTLASVASAQYTDLPDILVQDGVDVELDLNNDGITDLTFMSSPPQEFFTIFSVTTGPGTSVYGVDRGLVKEALAVAPGVLIGGSRYLDRIVPQLQGTLILSSRDCSINCIDGFSDRATRFLAVKVDDLFGWVRIETRFGPTGRVLVLLDYTLSSDPQGVFTLIDGFYIQQICKDGLERVTVAMGGFQGESCFLDGRLSATFTEGRIEFTATICPGGSLVPSPWASTVTFLLPETGVYEITTIISVADVPYATEREPILLGCCPADWNADGDVNLFDITAFMAAWTASSTSGIRTADINLDGQINYFDVAEYFVRFNTGCGWAW